MILLHLIFSFSLLSSQSPANQEDPNLKSPSRSSSQLMNSPKEMVSLEPSESNQFHCPGVVLDGEAVVQALEESDNGENTEADD